MNDHIIELRDVSKVFHSNHGLCNINLSVRNGEFLTLLGPSGCGKTTLLRLISGFENLSNGQILLNGKDMHGTPPQSRHVNTIFQNYALFPHLNIFENVAFGLRCNNLPNHEIKQRVNETLVMVKLEKYAQRKPNELSGGEQQRVAIARAIVNKPLVLLLDEPLSSLDYSLRKNMQIEMKQIQRQLGMTFIFVTHDQEEALSLSDRVVVMNNGMIEQIGTPREVYEEPKNVTVAKFIGDANILNAEVVTTDNKKMLVKIEGEHLAIENEKGFKAKQKVHLIIRPEDLRVWDKTEVTDTKDMFPGVVEEVIYKGSTVDLMVRLKSNTLLAATEFFDEDDENLQYTIGEPVWVNWIAGWEWVLANENDI